MASEISDPMKHANNEFLKAGSTEASLDNRNTSESSSQSNPHLLYKVRYRTWTGDRVLYTCEDDKPIVIGNIESKQRPALELIQEILTHAKSEMGEKLNESPSGIDIIKKPFLRINSPAIINALQKMVHYCPDLYFSGDSVDIPEPFSVLIHHESELASFREAHAPGRTLSKRDKCERAKYTYEHLGALQDFLKQKVGSSVEAERLRHKNGFATFDMLWLLLKPGATIYCDTHYDGRYDAYVVQAIKRPNEELGNSLQVEVETWNLDFGGSIIVRRMRKFAEARFEGEKKISTLRMFPCEFWEGSATKKSPTDHRKSLEERGRMFFKLTSKCCMNYEGLTISRAGRYYKGQVMIDTRLYYDTFPEEMSKFEYVSTGLPLGASQCLCAVCLELNSHIDMQKEPKFSEYVFIDTERTHELTAHQYLLCSDQVPAYLIQARDWAMLEVGCISNASFDKNMIDTLVMSDERRGMIKALAADYAHKSPDNSTSAFRPWAADFVEAKGEGKIFLLHGKPGVGKTYTAECIAQFTQRPLLSLTAGDIGTDPAQAESNLNGYFAQAKRWDAIILIDEAEIFMERREVQDLTRNSLVSGFLRAMENCQTILFLTTNRVGAFDDAFISRIHVPLYYPDLSEDDRKKIWRNFFNKLTKERGDIMRVPIDTKDYTNGQEVRALKWNGREIRNAFQTAVALADYEGAKDEEGKILLKETHIMQIVRMSREFKTYLNELHQGDESKRAERQRVRFDEYDAQSGESGGVKRKI